MKSFTLPHFTVDIKIVLFIMIILTAILVFFVLKEYNFIGTRKGTTKAKADIKKDKDIAKKRARRIKFLMFCDNICNNYGFKPNDVKIEKYNFFINRCEMTLPYIDRLLRPRELLGFFKLLKFVGCFLAIFLTILSGGKIFLLLLLLIFSNIIFENVMDFKIMDEDKEIEEDFPDLYLLVYSRLLRGTNTRLAPVLDDYIRAIDAVDGDESHKSIRKMVLMLRKNIELYGDDSIAIQKMRTAYKSAMVVNFFNLAVQSLRGVDNRDKLLAFKMELSQKKLDAMTEKANKMVAKGQKVILLIYVILAEFVILSWIAKAGLSLSLL